MGTGLHGDTTAGGKPHFAVLDGLRGTAALLVVIFHIQGITVLFEGSKVVLHHAPLAVDFFFMMSGFVIGYAYDDRWPGMTVRRFLGLRLARLHPLLVLGMILGLVSYLADPFAGDTQSAPGGMIALAFVLGVFALPSLPLANRWTDTHPLNGPAWTLFQEYLGNVLYALILRHLSVRALGMVAGVAALALVAGGAWGGTLDAGSYWETAHMALIRLVFPFVTGLLLFRLRASLPRIRMGFLPLSLILLGAFLLPIAPPIAGFKVNGVAEALAVIVLFPLIVIAGAHSDVGVGAQRLAHWAGKLSYPLYITHYPFLYLYMNLVLVQKASPQVVLLAGVGAVPLTLGVAALAVRWWDAPIRSRLAGWLAR